MALTSSTFKVRYPEFATETDARIELFLGDAEDELSVSVWGDYYDKGAYALTAHMLQLGNKAASATIGAVSSKKVGDLQVNFSVKSPESNLEEYYKSTPYGAEYYRLLQLVAPTCFIAHEDFVL